jgi:hypothetical protein
MVDLNVDARIHDMVVDSETTNAYKTRIFIVRRWDSTVIQQPETY